jgi:hypothetical protein
MGVVEGGGGRGGGGGGLFRFDLHNPGAINFPCDDTRTRRHAFFV